jgi:hypothetical protein
VAAFVDKILHAAKAAELPVQQPMKFDLLINSALRTKQSGRARRNPVPRTPGNARH